MKYISLLRGINVSGKNKIVMRGLKSLYEKLGFNDVLTYIQSGNVVFSSLEKDTVLLKKKIEMAIEKKYNFNVPVEIRTNKEISSIIKSCPFANVNLSEDGTKILLTFLSDEPKQAAIKNLLQNVVLPEKLEVSGKEVFLFCPNGYGKSKLSNNFLEKNLDVKATTRNWKTIHKLYELSL